GSNPKNNGGLYDEAIEIPSGTKFIQAIAVNEELGIYSEVLSIPITERKFEINKEISLVLSNTLRCSSTVEVYKLLESLTKHKASIAGINFDLFEQNNTSQQNWMSLSFDNYAFHNTNTVSLQIDQLRENFFKDKEVDLSLNIEKCMFEKGQNFEDWVAENKQTLETYRNNISQ
ncbi:hypothetical protein JQK62_19005, partial [Leptospira santarosai]|nr:hypothetical protein [Leptospira santarosai]